MEKYKKYIIVFSVLCIIILGLGLGLGLGLKKKSKIQEIIDDIPEKYRNKEVIQFNSNIKSQMRQWQKGIFIKKDENYNIWTNLDILKGGKYFPDYTTWETGGRIIDGTRAWHINFVPYIFMSKKGSIQNIPSDNPPGPISEFDPNKILYYQTFLFDIDFDLVKIKEASEDPEKFIEELDSINMFHEDIVYIPDSKDYVT